MRPCAGTMLTLSFWAESLEIATPAPGRPTQAEQDGAISLNASKLRLQEREGSIRWQVKLAPKEEETLIYCDERYVPSQ